MERLGIRTVQRGDPPLPGQIALIRRVRRIVAPPRCRVLETFPATTGTRPARLAMSRISRVFEYRHALRLEAAEEIEQGWSFSLEPLLARFDPA